MVIEKNNSKIKICVKQNIANRKAPAPSSFDLGDGAWGANSIFFSLAANNLLVARGPTPAVQADIFLWLVATVVAGPARLWAKVIVLTPKIEIQIECSISTDSVKDLSTKNAFCLVW